MSRGPTQDSLIKEIPDKKIRDCITECLCSMKEWGLEVKEEIHWSLKMMDAWGTATQVEGETFVRIALNQGLATQSPDEIKDTIFHELAHVLAGVRHKHGAEWKRIVQEIRDRSGLPINQNGCVKSVTDQYWLQGYKYVLKCQKCGQSIGFNEENDLVRNPDEWDDKHNCKRFTHRGCGGTWVRTK